MAAPPFSRKHILVVDDDPFVCQTVTMLLQFDGHEVETASSGSQALAVFELSHFDLVITDLFMPAMKGDELADAIKKRSPRQPVMMLTAYPEKLQDRKRPLAIDFVVGKPFELETLRAVITKLGSCGNPEDPAAQN